MSPEVWARRGGDGGAGEGGEPDGLRGVGRGCGDEETQEECQGHEEALKGGFCSSSHRRLLLARKDLKGFRNVGVS